MKETALITGASSGIGWELAKLFAKDGYNLVITARREEKLKQLADELKSYNVNCEIIVKDLSDPTAPKELFDEIRKKGIHIDVLVNNAGFGIGTKFIDSDPVNELAMLQTNIIALTALTRYAILEMKKKGKGKILNLGSTGSFSPCPNSAVYCATKAYVLSLSEAIAEELKGTGITVTTLCPGPTATGFAATAGVTEVKSFNSPGVMQPSAVAKIGYEALMKGKTLAIAGLQNKLMIQSIRVSPRKLAVKVAGYIMSSN